MHFNFWLGYTGWALALLFGLLWRLTASDLKDERAYSRSMMKAYSKKQEDNPTFLL